MIATAPASPRTKAEVEALVIDGVRDCRHAALFLGVSTGKVRSMLTMGELWSFRRGGKRVIPVVELRRRLAWEAMSALGLES